MHNLNPFITRGYLSPHYFCDRKEETRTLISLITNGNNVTLMSLRRLGKTGLIRHCFEQPEIKNNYHTFLVDIYSSKNLSEFVCELGRTVLDELKSKGRKVWERFLSAIASLRGNLSFDINGVPEWGIGVGDIKAPDITLDEIFSYLKQSDKPCIVAVDEFQTLCDYPENNVEAMLRTRIQANQNCFFIFSGSKRHLMAEMFASPSRPFYQSTMLMKLEPIACESYVTFAQGLFREGGKEITEETIEEIYQNYNGVTWYIQSVLNTLYMLTQKGETCSKNMVPLAVEQIVSQQSFAYDALLFQLPPKQKELLIAIAREGVARNIMSQGFLRRYRLTASGVQGAVKGLLEKDFITSEMGDYSLYDQFFAKWLIEKTK